MKSYLRFLSRNMLYTAIMVVGLSVSLAFVIIMGCFTWQQYSVGRHYPEFERTYCLRYANSTFSSLKFEDRIPEIDTMTGDAYKNLGNADSALVYYEHILRD